MTPLLIACATAAVLAGIITILIGVVGTSRASRPPSRLRRRLQRAWTGDGLSLAQRRSRQITALLAAAAAVVVWLITTIPLVGLLAGLAVIGVPWLLTSGRAEQRAIAKLEALEVWTRRLTDLVRTGLGLNQAIVLSCRDAPAAIHHELTDLGAQMQAGVPVLTALDRFAAALADATSDQVIIALRLHATDRGQRLADILDKISDNIAREVLMRREIWASRADPRLTTRFMTAVAVIVCVLLFSNTTYTRPYQTLVGQLVLAGCAAAFVILLMWIRGLSQPKPVPRLLATDKEVQA